MVGGWGPEGAYCYMLFYLREVGRGWLGGTEGKARFNGMIVEKLNGGWVRDGCFGGRGWFDLLMARSVRGEVYTAHCFATTHKHPLPRLGCRVLPQGGRCTNVLIRPSSTTFTTVGRWM